tara:strand:- start:150 stop:1613 length:1464 start_codon:yes stop_codon:yes gene_type:complete
MGIVRNQSIKNSISFYIGMAIGAINTLFVYPYVFDDDPEKFGLIQIIIAYSLVISTITTLGVPKTFIRFFPSIQNKGQLYLFSLVVPFLGFLLAVLFYFFFKDIIFQIINVNDLLKDNFFYIILLVFFIGFYDVLTSISRSFLSAVTPNFINEVFLKLYSFTVLILYWNNFFDFSTFLLIYLFGFVIKFMILFFIQFFNNRLEISFGFNNLNLQKLFSYGLFVLVSGASMIIITRLDIIMIGSLLDLEQVAFYTIAFFIGNAIKVPARSVIAISSPLVASAWENKNLSEIKTLYTKSSINQIIVGGIFFLCIWLNIDDIFSFFPEKYQGGKWVVLFIALAQLFNMSSGVSSAIIVNSNFYKYDLYTTVLLMFFTISTNYLLIPIYGINGAAMATATSVLIFNFFRLFLIWIKLKMTPFNFSTLKVIGALLLIYILLSLVSLNLSPFINILIKSSLVILLYLPINLYCNLSIDINEIFYEFKNRFINN